jgi:hypothetical protein
MQILDREQNRSILTKTIQQPQQCLEHTALRGPVSGASRRRSSATGVAVEVNEHTLAKRMRRPLPAAAGQAVDGVLGQSGTPSLTG